MVNIEYYIWRDKFITKYVKYNQDNLYKQRKAFYTVDILIFVQIYNY